LLFGGKSWRRNPYIEEVNTTARKNTSYLSSQRQTIEVDPEKIHTPHGLPGSILDISEASKPASTTLAEASGLLDVATSSGEGSIL